MPISDYQINRKDIIFIFIILALAMAFRVLYLMDYLNSRIYPVLQYSDSYSYFLWAKDIAGGDFWGSKVFMKWPLYAYFLGLLLKLFKNNLFSVYLFQYLLGAANCVLVYFIARRIFNQKTGLISGLLCACCGLFIFYDALLIYTSLSLFLNSLLFLFILGIADKPDNNKLFWLGIFLGICVITQASIGLFGILAIIWVLKRQGAGWTELFRKFLFFLLGLGIIVGSVTLKNFLAEKDFVLVAGNVGFNFYSGNNPQANGTFYCPPNIALNQEDMFRDSRIIASAQTGRDLKTSEVSAFWFNKSLTFIRNEPVKWLGLLSRKINYAFGSREFIHDLEYNFLSDKIRIFKVVFMDLRFILPFSLLGAFLAFKKFPQSALLYLALISSAFSISLFFVTARYRMVMLPYLLIFAAFGLLAVWDSFKNTRYIRFLSLSLVLLLSFILIDANRLSIEKGLKNFKFFSQSFNYHLDKAFVYENSSDYQNALKELDLAQRLEADNYRVIFRQGVVYFRLDNHKLAEEKFKHTIKINPLCQDAYYNLGLIYNRQSRFIEAEEVLKKAVSLDPENIESHFELGLAYKANGSLAAAKQELSLALKKINRWRSDERAIIEKELKTLEK